MKIPNFFSSENNSVNRNNSNDDFWKTFPLISSTVIVISVFIYLGVLFDGGKTSEGSFFHLLYPSLNEIRNGQYWGIFTSSLVEINILFLVWGIGWMWYFGKTIENRVSVFFYLFLVISAILFSQLAQIALFGTNGVGQGGIIYSLSGFVWFKSIFEEKNWYFPPVAKFSLLAFLFLCILVTYAKIFECANGALIGGLIWGMFIGFITTIKSKVLQISIPTAAFGIFSIPIIWAPWQSNWHFNEAYKYYNQRDFGKSRQHLSQALEIEPGDHEISKKLKVVELFEEYTKHYDQRELEKAKISLSRILKIEPGNEWAENSLKIIELYEEYLKYYRQKEFEKARQSLSRILEINPDDGNTKNLYKVTELYEEYLKSFDSQEPEKARLPLSQIIEIEPENEWAKKELKLIELYEEYIKYNNQREFEKVRQVLLQILEINPNSEFAKENLKRIQNKAR